MGGSWDSIASVVRCISHDRRIPASGFDHRGIHGGHRALRGSALAHSDRLETRVAGRLAGAVPLSHLPDRLGNRHHDLSSPPSGHGGPYHPPIGTPIVETTHVILRVSWVSTLIALIPAIVTAFITYFFAARHRARKVIAELSQSQPGVRHAVQEALPVQEN